MSSSTRAAASSGGSSSRARDTQGHSDRHSKRRRLEDVVDANNHVEALSAQDHGSAAPTQDAGASAGYNDNASGMLAVPPPPPSAPMESTVAKSEMGLEGGVGANNNQGEVTGATQDEMTAAAAAAAAVAAAAVKYQMGLTDEPADQTTAGTNVQKNGKKKKSAGNGGPPKMSAAKLKKLNGEPHIPNMGKVSCMPCRRSKVKCSGPYEAQDDTCQRCRKTARECFYKEHQRGRPRKHPLPAGAAASNKNALRPQDRIAVSLEDNAAEDLASAEGAASTEAPAPAPPETAEAAAAVAEMALVDQHSAFGSAPTGPLPKVRQSKRKTPRAMQNGFHANRQQQHPDLPGEAGDDAVIGGATGGGASPAGLSNPLKLLASASMSQYQQHQGHHHHHHLHELHFHTADQTDPLVQSEYPELREEDLIHSDPQDEEEQEGENGKVGEGKNGEAALILDPALDASSGAQQEGGGNADSTAAAATAGDASVT